MKMLFKILIVTALMSFSGAQAQVSVNVNLGTPPAWGPAGYTDVNYYYIPDIETYYDVRTTEYIYLNKGTWTRTRVVPAPYKSYNFYNGYKVVMTDYKGKAPYTTYKSYKVKYPKGYKGKPQKTIGVPPGQAKKATGSQSATGHGNEKNKNNGKKH
jgi:hypothetical protein